MTPRESNKSIPTSRVRRTATVGKLAASEAVKQFGTRAANVTRGEEASERALAKRQLQTAKQIVAALGTMKGAAMKLGQVMSFLDVGLVEEEYREEFQRELAKLRDAAPTVSFKQMRRVIEDDLEQPIADVFESFVQEPIAAASIGQVYRATLKDDGREVAVKVQYPGVAAAVRADMQNLDMIMRLLKRMTPGMDAKAIAAEIRERIGEELDYELEAQNQQLARAHIPRPPVHRRAGGAHEPLARAGAGDGVRRRRRVRGAEESVPSQSATGSARSCSGSSSAACTGTGSSPATRTRATSCCWPTGASRSWTSACSSACSASRSSWSWPASGPCRRGTPRSCTGCSRGRGSCPNRTGSIPSTCWRSSATAIWWYTTADEPVQLTPEIATQVMIESSDPRSSYFAEMRHQDMRPEHLFGRRMELLTLAVLSQLRARANWHRIAREWMYGDEPVTELGREELEFYAHTGVGARS